MPRIVIIGAGLAGLACARRLTEAGVACIMLESSDGVGGRARTDTLEGFQLDRGFQVFLTGYPEARRTLDYAALDLKPFHPGAIIRYSGRFHRLSDPLRCPQDLLSTLFNPIGSFTDKYLMFRLRQSALHHRLCSVAGGSARPTSERLRSYGFSEAMLTRFFSRFSAVSFWKPRWPTPCWVFEHVWAAFSRGVTALPRKGMGAIAQQLASALPPGTIRLNQRVRQIDRANLLLESGETLSGDVFVIATDDETASQLRGEGVPGREARVSTTVYFDAPAPPQHGPWLMLNGEGSGLVNTVCVLSEAAPSYAPHGRALISTAVTDYSERDDNLPDAVREFLRSWFGPQVDEWRHLRTDRIRRALPPVDLLPSSENETPSRVAHGLYLCGDYRESGTLDGALVSGRKAAETVLADHAMV
ncbi:MAG: FAD-dependent oxidoreductase [Nitrospira sp.]|nr:FAD-dependent oxidoreductase [Nitrospira sp.]